MPQRTTQHRATTTIFLAPEPHSLRTLVADPRACPEAQEVEVTVLFSYTPGYPATPPAYASGGDPPEPAMIDDVRVVGTNMGLRLPTDEELHLIAAHFETNELLVDFLLDSAESDLAEAQWDADRAESDAEWNEQQWSENQP